MYAYSELVQAAYDYLQQKNSTSNARLPQTMVKAHICRGYGQFARDTLCFKGTSIVAATSGTGSYAYPVDMFHLRRIRWSGSSSDLFEKNERWMDSNYGDWRTETDSEPIIWLRNDARTYTLYPIPSFTALSALDGTLATGSAVVTAIADTSDLGAGMSVSGTGISAGTTIFTVDSSTQITLSAVATATGVKSLTFTYALAVEGYVMPYDYGEGTPSVYNVPLPDGDDDVLALPDEIAMAPVHWAVAQLASRFLSDRETADKVVAAALVDYKRLIGEFNMR